MKRHHKTRIRASKAHGILLLDKPRGPSSRHVLDELDAKLRLGGLGHAGTLDPLASGLLIVLLGRARRLQDVFMGAPKTYVGTVQFGETSATLDGEGPITKGAGPVPGPLEDALARVIPQFTGRIMQAPPSHSALRIAGRRAYDLARAGDLEDLPERPVTIHSIEVQSCTADSAVLEIRCGSGTYIRSLARDLGEALQCGAWLSELRRTATGAFAVADAITVSEATADKVLSIGEALSSFGRVDVTEEEASELRRGRMRALEPSSTISPLEPLFAWANGVPVCRVKRAPSGLYHSCLLLSGKPSGEAEEPTGIDPQ